MFRPGPLWVRKRHCRPPRQPVDLAATTKGHQAANQARIGKFGADYAAARPRPYEAGMVAVMEARENRFTLVMFTSASTGADRVCGPHHEFGVSHLHSLSLPQRNS